MKKTFLFVVYMCLFFSEWVYSQEIGNYSVFRDNMNAPLKTGFYYNNDQADFQGQVCGSANHFLAIRGAVSERNYQLQIASTFDEDNKLFFRKIAQHSLADGNSQWYELATRKSNTFSGAQTINGKVVINGAQTINGNIFIPDYKNIVIGATSNELNRLRIYYEPNYLNTYIEYAPGLVIKKGSEEVMRFTANKNVGIGYWNPRCKLDVNGKIRSKELEIDVNNWSDFVFDDDYELPQLKDVESHIREFRHLPGIPTEKEVFADGINVGEMQAKILQKVEELTLYLIQQQNLIEELQSEIKKMKSQ